LRTFIYPRFVLHSSLLSDILDIREAAKSRIFFNAGYMMTAKNDTGMIFDIKRYAVHDGPGIRTTVFLKGCPLRCRWCHNPEGIDPGRELFFHSSRCLPECRECLAACPESTISKPDGILSIGENCRLHARCAEVCPTEALQIIGREVTVEDIIDEVEKDRIFFDNSGGGITISGGEPMMQPDFLNSLLTAAREKEIHTVVDTSGYAPAEQFQNIRDKVDLFFFDFKVWDDHLHREFTGVSNSLILENLSALSIQGSSIRIRIPVVPGFNDNGDSIENAARFLLNLPAIEGISLLPYHRIGTHKSRRADKGWG
jgi:pyruvate formate lyase activating enzyme